MISNADLYNGTNAFFISDRNNLTHSALRISFGYYRLPPRVYFNENLTLMAWIKILDHVDFQRFIDCDTSYRVDYLAFGLSYNKLNSPFFRTYSTPANGLLIVLKNEILINNWYHLTYVLKKTTGFIYLDGIQVINGTLNFARNVIRSECYLGRQILNGEVSYSSFEIDDLKIFDKVLTDLEINNEIFF